MRKPVLTIFYQFNPWYTSIGGIQTLINTFIKYAPREFEVRLVGTASDRSQVLGKWQQKEFAGREISFLPLCLIENDDFRGLIPTTIKYTAALVGRNYASDFMHFYRIEPTIVTRHWQGEKTLFIQNDIQAQIAAKDDKNAILWRKFPSAYFALEKMLVDQFHQIYSCNTESMKLYQQRYPNLRERVAFLKNTFDEEIFYPLPPDKREQGRRELAMRWGLDDNTRFIMFAGRLHPQKDPILLIRSIAALNNSNIHLLMAGNGELAEPIRAEIARLGLAGRVTMLGAVKQKELADLHRVCHALVLSSAFEGLPFVVLEALACGIPIVTTQAGETPKLLSSDSGIVCEERTPDCIANALRQVVMNPERYPVSACVRTAQPYAASTVINEVYKKMWQSWETKYLVTASR
ncbi:glycosyltransferase [Anabaena sp. UHCC 0399]|uniref:glycosyltransferase n=1 Tax=Anabaena sp. UHCC 0399 TaxID=3110238 RepID=UPI002B205DB1|nr:glycosyltransferase [Anabaena sp. UHCC 0399]MEA5565225.1 glycosyltransferase [Anabaena sp. UHCC 0399]